MYTPNLDFKTKMDQVRTTIEKQINNYDYLNDLYRLYKNTTDDDKIHRRDVSHPQLEKFCGAFDNFYKSVDSADRLDDSLHGIISYIARYRFKVTKTPLPFNHECFLPEPFGNLKDRVEKIGHRFPTYAEALSSICKDMEELVGLSDNPLLDCVMETFKKGVLYQSSGRNFLITKDYIETMTSRQIEVLSGNDLRSRRIADNLCIIGYPSWVSDLHIFAAPKFDSLHMVIFDFPNFNYRGTPQLIKPMGKMNIPSTPKVIRNHTSPNLLDVNPDEHIEQIDLEYIRNKFTSGEGDGESKNMLKCRLAVLSEGKVAYLTNEKGIDEKQRCLELDDNNNITIFRKKVSEIRRGDVILLRVGSSEDLIVETANKVILGDKSLELRKSQAEWKERLERKVEELGITRLSKELKDEGIGHANKSNIKRWMSERNIMLEDSEKFIILLKKIGYGQRTAETTCDQMKIIWSSHIRANSDISRKLLRLVREADLDVLGQQGWQEFQLEDTGAKIGLFVIQAIEGKDILMPSGMLDRPLEPKDVNG